MALSLVGALRHIVELRSDISVADTLRARRRRTRVRILHRIAQFVLGFITVSVMLVAISGVRAVGVTLMASAGTAGIGRASVRDRSVRLVYDWGVGELLK